MFAGRQHLHLIAYVLSLSPVVIPRAVIDTNVLTGAMLGRQGHNRAVLRACLGGRLMPLVGHALFLEYEDVLGRKHLFEKSPLNARERQRLFESFLSIGEWVQVYFMWRPNLRDE